MTLELRDATPSDEGDFRRLWQGFCDGYDMALPPEVYLIGCGSNIAVQGQASAQTMGFKAWNLLRMSQLALPVPPAFDRASSSVSTRPRGRRSWPSRS